MEHNEILDEVRRFACEKFGKRLNLVLLYGSAAYKKNKSGSDIDLLIVCENFNKKELDDTIDFVINLHKRQGIVIDNEVPFSRKLLLSKEDFENSLVGGGFILSENKYIIPPVEKTKDFLDSIQIAKRLALNAMTTPNVLVFGDEKYYNQMTKIAFENLVKIVSSALDLELTNSENFIDAIIGNGEKSGEMFLGYKPIEPVMDFLKRNLNSLGKFERQVTF